MHKCSRAASAAPPLYQTLNLGRLQGWEEDLCKGRRVQGINVYFRGMMRDGNGPGMGAYFWPSVFNGQGISLEHYG